MRVTKRDRERERPNQSLRPNPYNGHNKHSGGSYEDKLLDGTTSFFFTNFLYDYGSFKMWEVFDRWGKVWDIYIPAKRDKLGKRFGFVKFKDVCNAKGLEKQQDGIWIGSYRLMVNIPNFQRRQGMQLSNEFQHGRNIA